ncbi:MAG TPA: bifunctional nuclease family protein, partial [Stenomitos sp.]
NQSPPRPMTHDLLGNCLVSLGISLERVIIHSLEDNTFFAVLNLKQGEKTHRVDARPSDAIALALRLSAPIWVMEEVVADASIPVDQEADEEERQAFRSFIDNIRPDDFAQSYGGGEAPSLG